MTGMVFRDRREAGRLLARALAGAGLERPVVLGIPRGGLVVAAEVAQALGAPLDAFGAAKVGAPFNRELALAAVAPGGILVLNEELEGRLGLSEAELREAAREKERELAERLARLRRGRAPVPLRGRAVILVDDGVATGLTVAAAVRALRREEPSRLVLAVPVASREAVRLLAPLVDDLVCLLAPRGFRAVGQYYRDFAQVSDEEAAALLDASGEGDDGRARTDPGGGPGGADG